MTRIAGLFQHKALIIFMMGHFTVDMYGGLLVVMYPLAVAEFDLSNTSVGLIALSFTGASSLSQPLFGYLADRFGSRSFAVASMVWSAAMVGLAGLAPTYGLLVLAATLAGLGSGAYHPQGASNAAAAVGDARRNTAMSIYTVGGTGGYSIGPLIGAGIFALFGRAGTLAVMPFGVAVALAMWRQLRRLGLGAARYHAAERGEQRAVPWALLLPVILVVMIRSWVELSAVSFVPVWFRSLGYSSGYYSTLTTLILGCGAIGTLVGGVLADRIGPRRVLTLSLLVSLPFLLLFAQFPGGQSFILGPLFAFFADMGLSITLVVAQRLLPGRVGVASGFILGMGFVTGGIGVPITGALADRIGTGDAIALTSLLLLVAAGIAARIPERTMRQPPPLVAPAAEPAR